MSRSIACAALHQVFISIAKPDLEFLGALHRERVRPPECEKHLVCLVERRAIDVLVLAHLAQELVAPRPRYRVRVIGCLDVDYRDAGVTAACVGADAWTDEIARIEVVVRSLGRPAAYQPGAFYERELPYLLEALARMPPLDVIVVDAYVWLGPDQPGLGKRLHDALGGGIVVGVAKTKFAGAGAIEVRRGDSDRPLHVTAVGIDPAAAARHVAAMHGEFRIPTLLRRVDALARGHAR
jgi:deoxyribonuclease V